MQPMHYIGLDVHERTLSYFVKDGSVVIHAEGILPATRAVHLNGHRAPSQEGV